MDREQSGQLDRPKTILEIFGQTESQPARQIVTEGNAVGRDWPAKRIDLVIVAV